MSDRRAAIRDKIAQQVEIVDMGYVGPDGQPSPCHVWTGGDSGNGRGGGYARMWLDGQVVAVHIVSYVNEHGFVPGKRKIDHKCRTRRCVREDHLEMVTHKENCRRRDDANGIARKPRRRRKKAARP